MQARGSDHGLAAWRMVNAMSLLMLTSVAVARDLTAHGHPLSKEATTSNTGVAAEFFKVDESSGC